MELQNTIPDDTYICKITKVECKKSKTNKDMLSITFEISDKESKFYKQKLYMNQVIDNKYGCENANKFLKSLDLKIETGFNNAEELTAVIQKMDPELKLMEFDIEVTTNGSFKSYNVTGIYDLVEVE